MNLRFILIILSLLAVFSASASGYLYYDSLRESAVLEAERQALLRVEALRRNIAAYLSESIKPVRALAAMDALEELLEDRGVEAQARAEKLLDLFTRSLEADVCYLMDSSGDTIASSNRDAPDSFVGENFAFRPYFQHAIRGRPHTYLALGVTSGKRGAYYSQPVRGSEGSRILGVVVIKTSIEMIEKELLLSGDEILLVADPHGIVFICSRPEWLYRSLAPLSPDEIDAISGSRQFGPGPFENLDLAEFDVRSASGPAADRYLIHRAAIGPDTQGWALIHLARMQAFIGALSDSMLKSSAPLVLALCSFIGLGVFMLYRSASHEISRRRQAESALRASEERYRSLYHNTPAMLHSIDPDGRMVSVSEYWSEAMGWAREEVVGRRLTEFMSPDSRRQAETTVMPAFFRDGFCKNVPYRFVRRDGTEIDILLSAIADRDPEGRIARSLAVCVDVTEARRAEEALERAQEELRRYTQNLERQVRKRTAEIAGILRHTPAVVYIKDISGRYTLANSRYEELFGKNRDQVHGRTDQEVLPWEVAEQFRASDGRVLAERRPLQVEERIGQPDGVHTCLSVKFPLYDEEGEVTGLCGIMTDITAVKKAEDRLRRLSAGIIAGQEKERAALARELHDELGQVLTALRMDSVWLNEHLTASDPAAAERAQAMCRLIDREIEEVRSMAFRLRPSVLDKLGIVDALDLYTADFERRTGITCLFEHGPVPGLADPVATAAYRIAQEALTNVARHARAGRVAVVLKADPRRLSLAIVDDGQGFDAPKLSESDGMGMEGMRERAALVGGRLEIHSQPGHGNWVELTVPLAGGREEGT